MVMSREDIQKALETWLGAWNRYDLGYVMDMLHDAIVFEHWDGRKVAGKETLWKIWGGWFDDPGGFRFIPEDVVIDVEAQKVLFQWVLEWPSRESSLEGRPERRRGLDVLHFKGGKIFRKLTYCKTSIEIEGARIRLVASP